LLAHCQNFGEYDNAFKNPDGVLGTPEKRLAYSGYMEGFDFSSVKPDKQMMEEFARISPSVDNRLKPLPKGYYGFTYTGVASRADAQANEDGYQFYGDLYCAYQQWNGKGKFKDVFSFKNVNLKNWNETNNRSEFRGIWVQIDSQWHDFR
jgi:hypothetical protein